LFPVAIMVEKLDTKKRYLIMSTLQVDILDSRRSLNINIFLRQFRSTYTDLVQCLAVGDSEKVGAERLRTLDKNLPEEDEMDKVLKYAGDPSRLGLAERFCRELASLSQ
jgi:hypothetical protein